MGLMSLLSRAKQPIPRRRRRASLTVDALDTRQLLSTGLAFVGMSKAPAAEMTTLATQIKTQTGEVEVSFLPFEFNPSNPFGNATRLVQETMPSMRGSLRLTVDLEWFVHSSGVNQRLDDGGSALVYGRQAQQAFWSAWDSYNPSARTQPQAITGFLSRVRQADAWVGQIRAWAANNRVQNKLGVTFVPVLEDEYATQRGYTNIVNAIKAQQRTDGIAETPLRRSRNGDNSTNFRISGVSMELHGTWSSVRGLMQAGDTWSNDGSVYAIENFVADGRSAKNAGMSVLYWNTDMNGTPKTDTNWASRTVNVFSGAQASANKARLTLVLGI